MTKPDKSNGRYINTDKDAVQFRDQNVAVIGPARLSPEEETQQQIDKGISVSNINVNLGDSVQSPSLYGAFHPDYYYLPPHQEDFGAGECDIWFFWATAFLVTDETTLDSINFYLTESSASADQGTPQNTIQFAVYASQHGLPYAKLYESSLYDAYTDLVYNVVPYLNTIPVNLRLSSGKYWIVCVSGGGDPDARTSTPKIEGSYISQGNTISLLGPDYSTLSDVGFVAYPPGTPSWPYNTPPVAGSLPELLDVTSFKTYSTGTLPSFYMKFTT